MGLFLSISCVIDTDREAVAKSIESFAINHGGSFARRIGTTDDPNIGVISQEGPHATVLHPNDFMGWDELSQHVSAELQVPVFSFHIHDGDFWMFVLFDKGVKVTQFNPIPDYWAEHDSQEKASWAGDVQAICRCVSGVSPDSIGNYIVEWTDDIADGERKAYSDDEFAYGVDWQLTDFMRRVGLKYPIRDDGIPGGQTFYLQVDDR